MIQSASTAPPVAHAGGTRGTVHVSVDVDASPERVWNALTQNDAVARWFGDLHESLASGVATRLDFGDADFFALAGVQAEFPRRLRYDWSFLGRGPISRITWDVEPSSAERSTVTVRDADPKRGRESVSELTTGWTDFLRRLARHLATGEITRYDWRRSFEGTVLLEAPVATAAARLLGAEVEGRWLPFGGRAVVDRTTVQLGGTPARYVISEVQRNAVQLRFALQNQDWERPTRCSVRVTAHGPDSLLNVEQTGWDAIGERVSPMTERRRFAELWIAALDRAKSAL